MGQIIVESIPFVSPLVSKIDDGFSTVTTTIDDVRKDLKELKSSQEHTKRELGRVAWVNNKRQKTKKKEYKRWKC